MPPDVNLNPMEVFILVLILSTRCFLTGRQLLLCRVALGKPFYQFSAVKMAHAPPGHHSVIGRPSSERLSFAEYVMYRGEQVCRAFSQELYFLFLLYLSLSFKRMLGASWFAIILAEIRTRWILREKADCNQSTFDYIRCDFGIHFWARMTKAKFTCNRIFIPPIPSPWGLLICGRIKVVFSEKFVVSFIFGGFQCCPRGTGAPLT